MRIALLLLVVFSYIAMWVILVTSVLFLPVAKTFLSGAGLYNPDDRMLLAIGISLALLTSVVWSIWFYKRYKAGIMNLRHKNQSI